MATTISQLVLLGLVAQTGGLQGRYVGYLTLPIAGLIMAGWVRQILVLSAITAAGMIVMAAVQAAEGNVVAARDLAISRLLLVATYVGFCVGITHATGKLRHALAERVSSLAAERSRTLEAALSDALTGLRNRRAADVHLEYLIEEARRTGLPLSIMAIDVDELKTVNDTSGHEAGDDLLRAVGDLLKRESRASDVAARVGGDEFLVLLPNATAEEGEEVAGRLALASRRARGAPILPSFSYGIATLNGSDTPADLLRRADAALYAAKRLSRARRASRPISA